MGLDVFIKTERKEFSKISNSLETYYLNQWLSIRSPQNSDDNSLN